MRVPTWSVLLLLSMPAAACGGDDLTLPGPGDPAALSIVAGDDQRAPPGEALTDPLVVQLLDSEGLPVEGRAVVQEHVAVWPLRCAQGDSGGGAV